MKNGAVGLTRRFAAAVALAMAACGGGGGDGGGTPVTISLVASAQTPAQVHLAWTAPADQTEFDVFRNGVALYATHIGGRSLTEFTLEPATRYCYQLNAVLFPLGVVGTSNTACVTTPPTAGWPVSVIDTSPALSPSLAIDGRGASHASYRSGSSLVYLTNASGSWVRTVVDAAAGSTGQTSIAVDAAGAAHIGYYDANRGGLGYATNRSGAWATTVVTAAGGHRNALAVDADGHVHIAHAGDPNLGAPLMHASDESGSWLSEFVAAGAVQRVSIAIAGGQMHIGTASGDGVLCSVLHETLTAGVWTESVVSPSTACSVAMAVDGAGVVHLAYTTRSPGFALVYASNGSGAWTVTPLDQFYWIPGETPSIATDAGGRAHVGYTDHSGLLKYASNAAGGWSSIWVDTHAFDGTIQVGSDGRVRMIYGAASASGQSTVLRYTTSP